MSWSTRPGGAAPAPERPPYPPQPQPQPTQPYGNQQNMYPNYQAAPPGNTQQQQYWQNPPQQQPQYNQQYGQTLQHQDYQHNANQFYQQPPQFNQNYTSHGYNNTQHQGYEQNYYQNQSVPQNYPQNKTKTDGWEDNWDWGWDETSKQAHNAASQNHSMAATLQAPQPQAFNNANVIEESFASTDTWNWSMEDKKEPKATTPAPKPELATLPADHLPVPNNSVNEPPPPRNVSNQSAQHAAEEVKTLGDRDVVKERMPNLAIGKRFHLENLTPQWSIESQMSQESSDGPQTHSEGTYRSDNQSRNSSKSSPGPNTDNSNFNYSQSGLDEYPLSSEWSRHSNDESTLVDNVQSNSRRVSHDELSSSMQDMSIANRENPDQQGKTNQEPETKNVQDSFQSLGLPPSASPANFLPPVSSMMPQPPPLSASISQSSSASVPNLPPPPSSSAMLPPPTNFPPTSSTNPFKQSGPFSHKKVSSASPSLQSFPPPTSSTNLTSPSAVNKVSQHRLPVGFGANLETTPDNSERPDQPAMTVFRPMPVAQQIPDNMEVAPQNDRNEYLQTAHLSSGDYGENTDFSRNAPPPGLRRMVVGQQETEYSQNLNISGDEPPPGLARMVPGQQTEADNSYNQPGDNYMDRHIDGQPTENSGRPYRQADGQQTPDNYTQPSSNRGPERRPIGLDRMVPGEPSNDEYSQYQGSNYAGTNEQRVVMGVDHDYPVPADAGPSDIREQNVDGSDYSEQTPRNIIGVREASSNVSPDFNPAPEDQQREVTMEGENLQDLSAISSVELQFSREQTVDGADLNATEVTMKADASDPDRPVTSSRRQSLNRVNTSGEDSERDRAFKSSPRRDRDKHKPSRDRDRDRDRVRDKEGRYSSRGDRKYDRDDRRAGERRSDKDRRDRDRKERDESPDARRHKRSTRSHRYETEDTDYYSDRERERRRYREGSYASKPPRPDDKDRSRYEERDRNRRYNTIERERRYEEDRDAPSRRRERRDRYGQYRDIDPTRTYGNIRREEEERRRGQAGRHSGGSRPGSREALATDDDLNESLATSEGRSRYRGADARRARHNRQDPYYDGYGTAGYTDPYQLQRQQYQYYEHLRLTDPAAYMQVYKQVMAGHPPAPPPPPPPSTHYRDKYYAEGYGPLGYEGRAEERTSVHSGRSSANGLKGNDTYYVGSVGGSGYGLGLGASLRDAPSLSLRTDVSDRDLNTDASLNLGNLDTSTVRSERMTPCKFSTAHIKGNIGSRHVVVVRPSYPVDGLPATVQILSLAAALAHEPATIELDQYPGPLVKGVTHKKSVMEYCAARARGAARAAGRDVIGYVLLWDLLALLLRQNGVVVGTDIAELLMKNKEEYDYNSPLKSSPHNDSRRGSSHSGREEEHASPDPTSASTTDLSPQDELSSPTQTQTQDDERAALDRLREYLTYGNRQEALEWAMSHKQWGFALTLAAYCERRTRAGVAARFLASLPARDPLHTLLAHLQAKQPPAATCVSDERWGDWRPHVAIMLSNNSAKPDQDRRTLTQLGDSLSNRGLVYSAQFCYISGGVHVSRHPLAPLQPPAAGPQTCPRLALLLADPRAASLPRLATNQAIFATEIYEYALSLNQDYVINELQVYKLIVATRLMDAGQYERALAYVEQAARAVTRSPRDYSPALVARLADLADRLKYHDPALQEEPPLLDEGHSSEPSPRHQQQWLDDVKSVAHMLTTESQQNTPQHQPYPPPPPDHLDNQYSWGEQQQQHPPQQPAYVEPEETADYSQYYQQQQQQPPAQQQPEQQQQQQQPEQQFGYGEEWQRAEPQPQYADYWQADQYSYGERGGGGGGGGGSRRAGGSPRAPALPALPELAEPRAEPALRRRVHPKPPEPVAVAFARPAAPRAPVRPRPRPRPLRLARPARPASIESSGSDRSRDTTDSPRRQLSDLDIQIAHSPKLGVSAEPETETRRTLYPVERSGRYGKVISNTVETWARRSGAALLRDGTYKPLVFGGTYPIDAPASPPAPAPAPDAQAHRRELRRTIERSLDKFEAMLARRGGGGGGGRGPAPARDERRAAFSRRVVNTFDIDEPMNLADPPADSLLREKDAKYYVSGPKTFDIDEPVSFI